MNNRTLNDYCEFIVDCLHKTAPIADDETGYYSIRTPDIGRGRLIIETANRVSKETFEKWTIRGVPKIGDLILAREAPVGNIGIVPENVNVCCGQRTVHIRPDSTKIDPEFLVYLMNGDEIQGMIKGQSQGATVAHLNMEDIRALILPELPPLPIQRKIADILSAYDDLIEVNARRVSVLEAMAQSVYREWFGKVDVKSLPIGWRILPLSEIVKNIRETTNGGSHLNDLPYVPIENLPKHSLALSESQSGTEAQSSLILFKKNDILFGAMRSYFHKVVVAPFDGVTRSTCFVLRPISPSIYSYAVLTLFQDETVSYSHAHSRGATMPYAVWGGSFSEMPTVIPPDDLLERFNDIIKPLLETIQLYYFRQTNLRRTRDLLLPRLVSGEVGVDRLVGKRIIIDADQ
jgi:type I restriction enzyme S subunit